MNNNKNLVLVSVIVLSNILILAIFLLHVFRVVNWIWIIGLIFIFKGIVWISYFANTRKTILQNKKSLLFAFLLNPGFFCIFLGLGIVSMKFSSILSIISIAGIVLSIVISLPILFVNMVSNKRKG